MKVIIEGRPEEIAALLSGGTGRREAERRTAVKKDTIHQISKGLAEALAASRNTCPDR